LVFSALEDQLCSFTPDAPRNNGSPDRADALVWGLSELTVEITPGAGIPEYYRREAEKVAPRSGDPIDQGILKPKGDDGQRVKLRAPAATNVVYGGRTGRRYLTDADGTVEMAPEDAAEVKWERVFADA
jgi:hypothetical protein